MGLFEYLVLSMAAGFLFAAVVMAAALVRHGARLRAAALLSALAVSARRRAPLADELEDLAATLLRGDRERVDRAAAALREGVDLPEALRSARLIPPSVAPSLAAAAATGTLPRAFADEAARLVHRPSGAAATVWNAAFYALVTLTVVQAVLMFLLYYIVPKFKKIFEDFGTPLSAPMESLLDFGSLWVKFALLPLMLAHLLWLAGPALAVLWVKGYRPPGAALLRQWTGRRRSHTSRVLRCLANAAEAGRPFDVALAAYADAAESRRGSLRRTVRKVEDGLDVWRALWSGHLLTAGEARLAVAATAAGNLPPTLRLLADRLDTDRARRRGRWLALVQPAVTLFVGFVVGWVALAFFSPLTDLLWDLG